MRISKKGTGKNIRKLLAEKEITVREIQEEMELDSPQAVYKWLNGKALPSLENLMTLGDILNVSMEEILAVEDTGEKTVHNKRKKRIFDYPSVPHAYLLTRIAHYNELSLLISDSKTDWISPKVQSVRYDKKVPSPDKIPKIKSNQNFPER